MRSEVLKRNELRIIVGRLKYNICALGLEMRDEKNVDIVKGAEILKI